MAIKGQPKYWVTPLGISATQAAFQVDAACITALEILNESGGRHAEPKHFGDTRLVCDANKHGDMAKIKDWLAATGRPPSDLEVILWLARFARNEWANFPKRTRTQHSDQFQHISDLCHELRDALNATEANFLDGDGFGMGELGIQELFSKEEMSCLVSMCDHARRITPYSKELNKSEHRMLNILLIENEFFTAQVLLERMASAAQQLAIRGPLHPQPKKRGAERGYFVRRLGELFQRRYGETPHEVIAVLTTIALGEATDRELVAKLLA